MILLLPLVLAAGVAGASALTPGGARELTFAMITDGTGQWPGHLQRLRTEYDHDGAFWSGVLAAIRADSRPYQTNDIRANLLGDLQIAAGVGELARSSDWATHAPVVRGRAVDLLAGYGSKHKQRFVLMDILTDLDLWTTAEAEYLSAVFIPFGYPRYALPWLRLAHAGAEGARVALERALTETQIKTSFTVMAAAYEQGLVKKTRELAKLLTTYAADATADSLFSARRAYRIKRAQTMPDVEAYRTEVNALFARVFTNLRRRRRQRDFEVEKVLALVARPTARAGRQTPGQAAELERLLAWFESNVPAAEFFDVATSPCSENLSYRSAP